MLQIKYTEKESNNKDGDTAAENALVVMAVGLKQPWSYAIAYFLVNGLTARTQSQIIKEPLI